MARKKHPYLSTLSFDCPECGSEKGLWCQDADGRKFKGICEGRKKKYYIAYGLWNGREDWQIAIPRKIREEVERRYAEDVEKHAQGDSAEIVKL